MNKIIMTATTVSFGLMLAAAGTAGAQSRAPAKPAPTTQMKIAPSPVANNGVRDNTAHAWTAGCYAEFGPNAKYPDAAMLEKCLNW